MGHKNWRNIILILGILTVVSGIFLITEKDYFIGIAGSIVGLSLIVKQVQDKKNNQ